MSTSKYVSEIKTINQNQEIVYRFLSDCNNMKRFFNEYTLEQISSQLPNGNRIERFEADVDTCTFVLSKGGSFSLRIIERESLKTIKITGDGKMPFDVTLWIQLLPGAPYQTKMKLTLHAEMNLFVKMLAAKKIEPGLNRFADVLAAFPYS